MKWVNRMTRMLIAESQQEGKSQGNMGKTTIRQPQGAPGILPLEAQRLRGPRAHPYRGCLTANSKRLDRSPCSRTIPCSHCWNPIRLHFTEITAAFQATK